MVAIVTGRASDERILNWIKKRVAGVVAQRIADADGVSQPQVIQCTNKVKAADAAESGEDVAGAYW
ncbi:MAG: hypothetical protein CSA85_00525 [Alphaproteobacteria bacterium]|nr:MAG: hypothetical protein CSA85_00525 [Alphaproteobacteria bacterium]